MCAFGLKKVVHDLGKQFDNIVVNIFGASKSVLVKMPADKLIHHKLINKKSPK